MLARVAASWAGSLSQSPMVCLRSNLKGLPYLTAKYRVCSRKKSLVPCNRARAPVTKTAPQYAITLCRRLVRFWPGSRHRGVYASVSTIIIRHSATSSPQYCQHRHQIHTIVSQPTRFFNTTSAPGQTCLPHSSYLRLWRLCSLFCSISALGRFSSATNSVLCQNNSTVYYCKFSRPLQ